MTEDCPDKKPKLVIDSDWKQQVEREKQQMEDELKRSFERKTDLPPADFMLHCASLGTQALIFMGALAHPETGQYVVDLEQARFLIDTIEVLQAKTKGNLTPEEDQSLKNLLGDLKVEWVRALNRPAPAGGK
ncbi:MAG: DUF1844 domain-containing protein [Planctomycetaceae bacterium]|nr:hypothetical protein [Planctomycetota bacterium]NUO16476.1 DUF1844 domain-containing protein [Planctomycetaceae bacterium]GIK53244.1 MAG: hypothetical protein BroJett014_22170 [Planctomycetota bacterium]